MREPVQTSALELDGLFDCPRFGPLAHKHCLRRQLERQESTKRGVEGPPVRPHCATACVRGREIRAGLGHVPARTCACCGSALIGFAVDEPCPTCEARQREERGGAAPASAKRATAQPTHLWAEKLPDPPFVPPAAQRASAAARSAPGTVEDAMRPAPVTPARLPAAPTPARPAQPKEDVMPKGVRAEPCPTCKSMATCCACKRSGGKAKPPAPKVMPAPAKSAPKPAAKPRAAPRTAPAKLAPAPDGFDPEKLTDEQLAAAVHEAGRRAEDLRARAQRLEELVAEAAPRPADRAA